MQNTRIFKVDNCDNEIIETRQKDGTVVTIVIKEGPENEDFNKLRYDYLTTGLFIFDECAVTFIKADGTERTLNVSRSELNAELENKPVTEERYVKAAETRKKNHPNLLAVYDVDARCIKSINLKTLKKVESELGSVTIVERVEIDG
ncbi:hypothetical protein phiOC_p210 [Ochrobactrum phage vB_OspM_OC]|nr:hypothetical protein phiOC_p210 [Ochrobactrum phage vB_OspM_OC]